MELPRFSEMVVNRRRELGLTIDQAARVLRMKDEVLIAFEEGDFSRMPKSGYAQGMLSSYARYLGLNPRVVVDQFCEDLFEYEHGSSSHELRRRSRDARNAQAWDQSYSESTTTGQPRVTHGRSIELGAPLTPAAMQRGYPAFTSTQYESRHAVPAYNRSSRYGAQSDDEKTRVRKRPRNSSIRTRDFADNADFTDYSLDSRVQSQTRRERQRLSSARSSGDISRRRPKSSSYDDLRYGRATSYTPATEAAGRRQRSQRTRPERPNVRRRDSRGYANRQGRSNGTHTDKPSFLTELFADPRKLILLAVVVVALILAAIIMSSVSSCTQNRLGQGIEVEVAEAQSLEESEATSEQQLQAEAEALALAQAHSQSKADKNTQVLVDVQVADGAVSWVEIVCDEKSVVAETVTGPWQQNFNVKKSMTIQVSDTQAVTVMRNNRQLQFEAKASGVGSLIIDGADPELDLNAPPKDEKSEDSDQSDAEEQSLEAGSSSEDALEAEEYQEEVDESQEYEYDEEQNEEQQ
ncbi:MAG: helix-turn-helix domain-containing protein [Atopobiaceae bacterium]|nr:helix-turn-helix domain-containing protein [Atopobiaceae bacterium]